MCCPCVNWQSAKTICFSKEKFLPYQNQDINFDFSGKSRMKMIASERHWRLPSSPIVRPKHKDLLCKLKSVLIYTRIAKPFILPLQMFAFTKMKITFCKTAARMADTAPDWRLPSSPIVEKKHVHFPYVN